MRAPFDRLIDLYYGPDTASPLELKAANVPARLVVDDAFFERGDPFTQIVGYLTMDAIEPGAPEVGEQFGLDYTIKFGTGDFVSLTPGGPITHQVLRADVRIWETGSNYWRAHISPLLDVTPSECSLDYTEEYKIFVGGVYQFTMTRTGPTTWVHDIWTLEAETTSPGEDCVSFWKLTSSGTSEYWTNAYSGVGDGYLGSSTGGATRQVQYVP